MRREPEPSALRAGRVVHVVGALTDEVASFLGPATLALARSGVEQAVVMLDQQRHRHHVVKIDEAAELVLAPWVRSPLARWRAMLDACRTAFAAAPVRAVHLHGLLPCIGGARAARAAGVRAPVFFSPHGSLGTSRVLGALALSLARPLLGASGSSAIVNVRHETLAFERWKSVDLVESPVAEALFEVERNEARHPLMVTGGRSQGVRGAERFTQLAVLLDGEALRIAFNWIGSVDPVSRLRLTAANVGIFEPAGDAECASRLSAGWVYLAPGATRGFPMFLVEAMAAGLPCVALDCAAHRDVIVDGESGFLCASEHAMIQSIATLIDNPALRLRMGRAARAQARLRFGASDFQLRLLAAYAHA